MAKPTKARRRSADVDESLADELFRWRTEFAETYKRYTPKWSGESFLTRREYPHVPDGPNFSEGNNARSAVYACDLLLRILKDARSGDRYVFSQRDCEDFPRWYSVVASIKQSEFTWPYMRAGFDALQRPETMRKRKAALKPNRDFERRTAAERALQECGGDTKQAAKRIGRTERTLRNWLKAK